MLTKNDLEQIDNLMKKRIEQDVPKIVSSAFEDFYDNFFKPHVTPSVQQHEEIKHEIEGLKHEIKEMKRDIHGLKDETNEIKEYIKDNDKRINNLEIAVSTKN